MNARASQGATEQLATTLPIDAETISETICRALRSGSGPLDLSAMAELEEYLRGHIALLLPEARESVQRMARVGITTHRLVTRLNGIEQQVQQGLGSGALSAHVQVHQLARDCQWLLARHVPEARR